MSTASIVRQTAKRLHKQRDKLVKAFPWTTKPLVVGAPMRGISGPRLAVAIAQAGGLGFIGPHPTSPWKTGEYLKKAKELLEEQKKAAAEGGEEEWTKNETEELKEFEEDFRQEDLDEDPERSLLPVGVGFQMWDGNVQAMHETVQRHRPCAVWLFAPANGQRDLDHWTSVVRRASPRTRVWVQVGTVAEAQELATTHFGTRPDAIVLQGIEAGGYGRVDDGVGLMSLLPEVADRVPTEIPLIAAGGIADGRGAAAALVLGAAGIAMGTRFLAATEADVSPAYQAEVVRAVDGGACTVRTPLYDELTGVYNWPRKWSPRTERNRSWREYQDGVPFETLQRRHNLAVKLGGTAAYGPSGRVATLFGTSVGLVDGVLGAAEIVESVQSHCKALLEVD